MDEKTLQAIEERAKAATPGPLHSYFEGVDLWIIETEDGDCVASGLTPKDAEFYTAARSDVPALTEALREAWAEVARLKEKAEDEALEAKFNDVD